MLPLQTIRSDKDVDFTAALAQNAAATANLAGLRANHIIIRDVVVLSDQNLAWDLNFYTSDTFGDADLDLDTYIGSIRLAEGDGRQVAGAGAFRYDVHGLALFYRDVDATNELHVELVNRSTTSKNAGATGEVVALVGYEQGQWD